MPSVTEVIFALGAENQLAGNTTFCDYPEAARKVYKVGDFSNPSTERIVALKPRLVFATLPEQRATVEKLERMGIKVQVSRPKSLDSLFAEIVAVGKALGARAKAESLADSLRRRLNRISAPEKGNPPITQITPTKVEAESAKSVKSVDSSLGHVPVRRPRVYVEISEQPLMAVGRSSFLNEAIERAGGENLFGDIDKEYPVVTQEQVIARNPEVIFLLHPMQSREDFGKRLGWRQIAAVQAGQVRDDLNPDLLFRPGPRIVDGIEQMAAIIKGVGNRE